MFCAWKFRYFLKYDNEIQHSMIAKQLRLELDEQKAAENIKTWTFKKRMGILGLRAFAIILTIAVVVGGWVSIVAVSFYGDVIKAKFKFLKLSFLVLMITRWS